MHRTRWSVVISGHLKARLDPAACSEMIYSLWMEFEAVALQSRILGMGMAVSCWTLHNTYWLVIPSSWDWWHGNARYLIVATSDAVLRPAGPAILNGNLATVRWPLSRVKVNTKFDPPSCLLQSVMRFALDRQRTRLQSAPKSKLMWRSSSSFLLLRSQRALV